MAYDSYWGNVVLLWKFNGSNGSAVFTEEKGHAVTPTGNVVLSSVQAKSGLTSCLFDGAGDYLSVTGNASVRLNEGDFTVEAWVFPTKNNVVVLDFYQSGVAAGWQFLINTSGKLEWWNTSIIKTGSTTVPLNAWSHVVVERQAGSLRMFVNGVEDGVGTASGQDHNVDVALLSVGAQVVSRSPTYDFQGYIDEVRVTVGVARYAANFTPPVDLPVGQEPIKDQYYPKVVLVSTLADTLNGTTITDGKGKTLTGTAVVDNTRWKFNGQAWKFNGSNSYISASASEDFNFYAGDFTAEAWVFLTGGSGEKAIMGNWTTGALGWLMTLNSSNQPTFYWSDGTSPSYPAGNTAVTLNKWAHVAVTRTGSTLRIFLNGVVIYTNTSFTQTIKNQSNGLWIGREPSGNSPFNGYIGAVRITKGASRYTGAFTPSSMNFGLLAASYAISGTFKIEGQAVGSRTIRAFRRSDGVLLAQTTTDPSGAFTLITSELSELYVIAFDSEGPSQYDAQIFDRVIPILV